MARFKRPKNCINCPYKSGIFKKVGTEVIRELHKYCFIVNYKKGERFAKQGTPITHSLYLTHGMGKIFVEGNKKNTIIKIISPGEFIGLYSIFSEKPIYNFSASAVLDSQLCMIEVEFLRKLSTTNLAFTQGVIKEISNCATVLFDRLNSFNQKSSRGRIADILLYLADSIYHSDNFVLPFTRRELAELASISLENAVRLLGELKNSGIIDFKDKHFIIKQRDLLEKISLMG